jgi:hypothetical protein
MKMKVVIASLVFVFAQMAHSATYHALCTTVISERYTEPWLLTSACRHISNQYALSCVANMAYAGYEPMYQDVIRACGNIQNGYALACQQSLISNRYTLNRGAINACASVNNYYGLSAVRSFTDRKWRLTNDLISVAGQASSAAEALCVDYIARRYSKIPGSNFVRAQCGIGY